MHGLFIKDAHIKEHGVCPEMIKLFLRISRERLQAVTSHYQPLPAIASNRKQPLAITNNLPSGYWKWPASIVVCSWRGFTRKPDRFPFIFRQGQNRRQLGTLVGGLVPIAK